MGAKVSALLDAGADVAVSTGTYTPLSHAVTRGKLAIARLLVARGADPDQPIWAPEPGERAVTARTLATESLLPELRAYMAALPAGPTRSP